MRRSLTVILGTGILFLIFVSHQPIRAPITERVNGFFNFALQHQLSCEADNSCGRKAQYLSPTLLLARPLSWHAHSSNASVPKYIHQTWPRGIPPATVQIWSETWRRSHPSWEWVLWREEDNQRLVDLYFPWFQRAYAQLSTESSKAAVARYLYMYTFGGMYAEIDLECLRPFDSLFHRQIALSLQSADGSQPQQSSLPSLYQFGYLARLGADVDFQDSISSSWMAATANHPFFLLPIEALHDHSADSADFHEWAESLSGRSSLRHLIQWYESGYRTQESLSHLHVLDGTIPNSFNVEHSVTIFPAGTIFPVLGHTSSTSEYHGFVRKMHVEKTGM